MIPGLSGSLLSHDALLEWLTTRSKPAGRSLESARARLSSALAPGWREMGPAHGARAVFDRIAVPLAGALGLRLTLSGGDQPGVLLAVIEAAGARRAALIVTAWGRDPGEVWRQAVHQGIARDARWCLCLNGLVLRIVDARRTYTRRFAELDLHTAVADSLAFDAVWSLLHAEAFAATGGPGLDHAVAVSEQHRSAVRTSLQHGVYEALTQLMKAFSNAGRRRSRRLEQAPDDVFDESLTVVYRVLFLLFAEARGLVPKWHPTFRDSYTIESLRQAVELRPCPRGVWESLQAIARLAHKGCRAGALRVPPFNGRLFSPALAPLAETGRLDDAAVRDALLALTTRAGRHGRERISYADLGVEQLGGVYERILDFTPVVGGAIPLVRGGRRKASGSFYTPRSLTEYVVRRTLAPLVHASAPEQILALRILDPAMGSGAFLVAACRYLAGAYESAMVREGIVTASDLSPEDRAGFRRMIAQRCLFGVDLNPMAVQLGRLSLWLATLSGDRPLTFLDHHLRSGNSLAGASLTDIARRPAGGRSGCRRADALPLFEFEDVDGALASAVGPRLGIATGPGDTLEQVREKERMLAALGDRRAPLSQWRSVADLWCAGWFQDRRNARTAGSLFSVLADELLGRGAVLPSRTSAPLLDEARATAARERFFHWTLEFPEVFYAPDGRPLDLPGFDAVIGNPPWEMLRGDSGSERERRSAAATSARLTFFTRQSGAYKLQGEGHANLFQLFVERALSLVRREGRLGLVLPSGFATDQGCAALRRHVLDRTHIDACVSVENKDALFPIHRSLRFLLLCATAGASTPALPYRAGVRVADTLDRMPELGADDEAVAIPRALLERVSGPPVAIPEVRSEKDLALVSRVAFGYPSLGDPSGWGVRFGRELNATDDKPHFVATASGAPGAAGWCVVLEGKHIQPFTVDLDTARFAVPLKVAARLLDEGRTFGRARLAYRDVSSASNRVTLIAAIVPAGVVTTHTLFCLKDPLPVEAQQFLCGVFNSFVANYLVRLRVTTHVSVAIIDRLPVPRPASDSPAFTDLARLAAALACDPADLDSAASLQAAAGRLYGLTPAEFQHVLDTFPLVDAGFRRHCLSRL
ncbi:MAG: N-6 DNA methylase [Acidobacteria bacterium]|nr:N-6 DNA methylase [Acidobacteriota bacterium]